MFFDGNTEQLVKIGRAQYITSSRTGSVGLEFDVFNAEGQKGYFTLWFMRQDGSFIDFSYGKLQSIMAITGVTTLTPTPATISKYDYDAGKDVPTQMTVANELMNKYFTGLFINEFEVYQGEKKTKTQLFAAFNQKRQTLQEQKDQSAPQQIEIQKERMIEYSSKSEVTADNALRTNGGQQGGFNSQQTGHSPNAGATYHRGPAPTQQNNSAPNHGPSSNQPSSMPPGPVDDDIPFFKHFDGQF